MAQEIYDPLSEYTNVFRNRFWKVVHDTFAEMAREAQVDIETNRETCRQVYELLDCKNQLVKRIFRWQSVRNVLKAFGICGWVVLAYFIFFTPIQTDFLTLIVIGIAISIPYILISQTVNPAIDKLEEEKDSTTDEFNRITEEAWKQMEPLNRLFDWDTLARMMAKTIPQLQFDPYFTTQRLEDLKKVYHWDDDFNEERSVIYAHSGLINGNPFVICRTRKMVMGKRTYYGSKTIHWTTREMGADGKYHTEHHTETLEASVTAPYPYYYEKTRLIYGNTAAPDLIFHREKSQLAGKENTLAFKLKRRQLRNKARDLSHNDYAMMSNEDFETAFNTSDRNNNQQFALLFTPLAQESMMNLLKDETAGYGDDFDFKKKKMINVIIPDHLQEINLDMDPDTYRNFDYDQAEEDFYTTSAEHFRAIYFALAPLLCIPLYQQTRPQEDIYGHDMKQHSSFWEHEALANFWGQDHFKHPECVTDCILKTEETRHNDNSSTITVYAYGYRSEEQLTYVSVRGGDGKYHDVPVYWDQYDPVTDCGYIYMTEDNSGTADLATSLTQRIDRNNQLLEKEKMSIYRRHIASRTD